MLPALLLNYFGQGALVLAGSGGGRASVLPARAGRGRCFRSSVLATLATVIASQAVISGAFSLTRQAVQLGYLPRVRHRAHLRRPQIGQIYIPGLNWVLMIACIGLVLGFRSSSNLAAAYGVAVTTDMVFTTILFAVVARDAVELEPRRRCSRWRRAFLVVDLGFWGASLLKIPSGGWFPLVDRGGRVHGDDDVEHAAAGSSPSGSPSARCRSSELLERMRDRVARARAGHGGVPRRDPTSACRTRCSTTCSTTRSLHERVVLLAMRTETAWRACPTRSA